MKCHGIESNSKVEQDVSSFRHGLMYVTTRCASPRALAFSAGASSITREKLSPPPPPDTPVTIHGRNCGSTLFTKGWMSCGRPIVVKIRVCHSWIVWDIDGGASGCWATLSWVWIVICFLFYFLFTILTSGKPTMITYTFSMIQAIRNSVMYLPPESNFNKVCIWHAPTITT